MSVKTSTLNQRIAARKGRIICAEYDIIDGIAKRSFVDLQGITAALDARYDRTVILEALYNLERAGRITTVKNTLRTHYRIGA